MRRYDHEMGLFQNMRFSVVKIEAFPRKLFLIVEGLDIGHELVALPVLHEQHLFRRDLEQIGQGIEMIDPYVHNDCVRVGQIHFWEVELCWGHLDTALLDLCIERRMPLPEGL